VRDALGYRSVSIELGADHPDQDDPGAAAVLRLMAGDRRLGVLVAGGDEHDGDPADPETLAILRLFAASAANRILGSEAHAAAERLADTDALTGLGNRATFVRYAQDALRRATREVAILLCDMDGLKAINDSEGHAAGDARLRLTAGVLAGACADGETAHRLGDDEFAVLVPAGGEARAAQLAAAIDAALRAAGASASTGWAAGRADSTIDEPSTTPTPACTGSSAAGALVAWSNARAGSRSPRRPRRAPRDRAPGHP
jgi:diguanylate cyclase (GGDEF)-like protein